MAQMKLEYDDGSSIEITDEQEKEFQNRAVEIVMNAMRATGVALTSPSLLNMASLVFSKLVEKANSGEDPNITNEYIITYVSNLILNAPPQPEREPSLSEVAIWTTVSEE